MMPFPVALASPFLEKRLAKGTWIAEQKFDGHRMLVSAPDAHAWSRDGKPYELPPALREVIDRTPRGFYDSELIADDETTNSYAVSSARANDQASLRLVVFDLIVDGYEELTEFGSRTTYSERRKRLETNLAIANAGDVASPIAPTEILGERITCWAEALGEAEAVWARGGEGLILKETSGLYRPGKRMQTWMKVKHEAIAVLMLVGFESGMMGPFSIAVLEDAEGNRTSVKWKSLDWLQYMQEHGEQCVADRRRVQIEYTERTEDGGYREPRWDRWEDE
jgi:ATP-dependent DNA ligase